MNLGMEDRSGLFLQGGPGGRVMLGQHEAALQQELAQADFGEQVLRAD
jgi:hypothetical protein